MCIWQLLTMIPWGLIWEWTLRLAGLAALGPHMYIVGRRYRADAREELRKAREFASASKAQRRETLESLRRQVPHVHVYMCSCAPARLCLHAYTP